MQLAAAIASTVERDEGGCQQDRKSFPIRGLHHRAFVDNTDIGQRRIVRLVVQAITAGMQIITLATNPGS